MRGELKHDPRASIPTRLMFTRRRPLSIAALLAALALAACGGAAPPAESPAQEPLPPTPEGTLDILDRSENELRLALGEPVSRAFGAPQKPGPAPDSTPGAQPQVTTEASPPPRPPQPSPTTQSGDMKRPARAQDADASAPSASTTRTNEPCSNACRALASMERATEHLCTLAGSADARCGDARSRVQSARARVHAQCPACSGD